MKKHALLLSFVFIGSLAFAGTGQTKDMDITCLLIVSILGIIIYLWEIIDYISKNKERISSSVRSSLKKIKAFVQRMISDTMVLIATKDPLN